MALLEIQNLTVEFKTGHGWFRADALHKSRASRDAEVV